MARQGSQLAALVRRDLDHDLAKLFPVPHRLEALLDVFQPGDDGMHYGLDALQGDEVDDGFELGEGAPVPTRRASARGSKGNRWGWRTTDMVLPLSSRFWRISPIVNGIGAPVVLRSNQRQLCRIRHLVRSQKCAHDP